MNQHISSDLQGRGEGAVSGGLSLLILVPGAGYTTGFRL